MTDNWSYHVTRRPAATFPPAGIFTRSAREIYLAMRRPDVSPNGLGSAIQMTRFFINRAGKKLPDSRRRVLEKAIELLQIELRYLKQADQYKLAEQPKPVHPIPPTHKRIGGRYAK